MIEQPILHDVVHLNNTGIRAIGGLFSLHQISVTQYLRITSVTPMQGVPHAYYITVNHPWLNTKNLTNYDIDLLYHAIFF
jgi:hypothetical protein